MLPGLAPVAPAATTAQPRDAPLGGRVDRALGALLDVSQQRAQVPAFAAWQRKRSLAEMLVGAPRGVKQVTQRVLRAIILELHRLDRGCAVFKAR